jgi:transcription termination/antitermination protein NusA
MKGERAHNLCQKEMVSAGAMRNEFAVAFNEIAELRALDPETVLEALRMALVSAYRRDSNASAAQNVEATIDLEKGRARVFVEKEVVEDVQSANTEVDIETARYYEPECDLGDTVMVQVEETTKKFGRIAAQTAKQVILQKIREAERNALYEEFVSKEGDIINGTVQSTNQSVVTLSLGRAEAIMPRTQQIPRERYRPHDKVRCYVLEVKRSNRGPQIVVSRSHRNMLRRLLEFEIPEIYNGQIEIKNIAREAGHRSKVAVAALQDGIDPVGACIGMHGIRIQNIVKELHDEKIDVIEWNPTQEVFIEKALGPARVAGVYLDDDPDAGRTAIVIVPDDHLSLAIGREGQNARLAAKLTGWRIDIKSVSEAVSYALLHLEESPLMELAVSHADLLVEVGRIMEKKEASRAIMPEEYRLLNQFSDLAERRLQASRDEARQARLAEINAVKATLPQYAFDIPVQELDLPDKMIESLQPLENVGEIMLRFLIDENRLRRLLGARNPEEALQRVQEALEVKLLASDVVPPAEVVEAEVPVAAAEEADVIAVEDAEAEATPEPAPSPVAVDPQTVAEAGQPTAVEVIEDVDLDEFEDEDSFDVDEKQDADKRKKDRQKRRQLVYDEDLGRTVARRRRKGSRKRESWDNDSNEY